MKKAHILVIIIIAAFFLIPSNVSASGQRIYTSTADFDAGNKSDPGGQWFTNIGADQPTFAYISHPSAYHVSSSFYGIDRTYVGFQSFTTYLQAFVTFYDHQTKAWASPVAVGPVYDVDLVDGHGAPAIWVDDAGYVYAFWGSHATNQKLSRTTNAFDISTWTQLSDPSTVSTYPNVFAYNGVLYFVHRDGFAQGGDWVYQTSTNRGATWSSKNIIFDSVFPDGAYFGGFKLYGSKVYYAWSKFVSAEFPLHLARRNMYSCYWDLSTNHQFGIDGFDIGTSINQAAADLHCRVAVTATEWSQIPAFDVDSTGKPYILWVQGGNVLPMNVTFSRWDGSAWTSPITVTKTDTPNAYDAILVTNTSYVEAFITTSGIRQTSNKTDDGYSGDLERWLWNGATWAKQETIMKEVKNGLPLVRPSIPVNRNDEIRMVFDSWVPSGFESKYQGQGRLDEFGHPTGAIDKIFAWGTSGFIGNPVIPSGTTGTITSTDNGNVPDGAFTLANPRSDHFAFTHSTGDTFSWQQINTGDGNGTTTMKMIGGLVNVTTLNAGGTGRKGESLVSKFNISGNWDVRMKFQVTIPQTGIPLLYGICMQSEPDDCDSVSGTAYNSTEGFMLLHFASPQDFFRSYKVKAEPSVVQYNTTTATCNPCWLRMTKTGSTYVTYHSTNNVNWVLDGYRVETLPYMNWYFSASAFTNGVVSGNWAVTMDDFTIATGTLNDGYRTEGSWASPVTTFSNELVKRIYVNYTGADASHYISSIAVLSETNAILYTDNTKRSTGTSTVMTIPDEALPILDGANFKVRVTLKGDGQNSVIVNEIVVQTTVSPAIALLNKGISAFWLIIFGIVVTLIVIAAYKIRMWGA